MVNPWVILGIVLAWVASLGVVGKWQNTAGHESERVEWQARDNKQLAAANAKIVSLTAAARATEQKTNATIATMGADHAKEIEILEVRRRHDVVAARDGAIKLRVHGACPASPGGGAAGEVAAAPGNGDGGAGIELPREITGDLLALANDADQVADQLRACQGVVRAYFSAVNGVPIPVPHFDKDRDL